MQIDDATQEAWQRHVQQPPSQPRLPPALDSAHKLYLTNQEKNQQAKSKDQPEAHGALQSLPLSGPPGPGGGRDLNYRYIQKLLVAVWPEAAGDATKITNTCTCKVPEARLLLLLWARARNAPYALDKRPRIAPAQTSDQENAGARVSDEMRA